MRGDEPRPRDGCLPGGARVPASSRRRRNGTRAPPIRFGSRQEALGVRRLIGFVFTQEIAT